MQDCLLAACGIGSSTDRIVEDSKSNSVTGLNQSSFTRQLLRTKEVEKQQKSYERRPFESISNKSKSERTSDLKRSSEQIHKVSSFLNCPNNNSTFHLSTSALNIPFAKRFAIDPHQTLLKPTACNSPRGNVLCSSSTVNSTDHSSLTTHSCDNSSPVQRNSIAGVLKIQGQQQYGFRPSSSSNRVGPSVDSASSSSGSDPTYSSTPLLRKEFSRLHEISSNCNKALNSSKGAANSALLQTKKHSTGTLVAGIPTGDLSNITGSTPTTSCSERKRQSTTNAFNKHNIGPREFESPRVSSCSAITSPRTPQVYQAVTPRSSKTPISRKFPGPAGLLPKLSPGQNLDDSSFASPLPTTKKPSTVQSKVSQSSTSEDDDFNRDPWTFMYQEFLKNVPLTMRYTIIRAHSEAIQQTLDHGKVPCLCALVKAFSLKEADASVLLKDPTGEIHGTLHRKVLEDYQTDLAPGAGLILKHVSLFSPAPRKHYLNITPGNILQIYPADPQNIINSQPLASQCTQVDRKQMEHRPMSESGVAIEAVDLTAGPSEESTEEAELWNQKDCFEDLLEGLDDDDDLLDEALLL